MSAARVKALRIIAIVMLALLALQYELGMAVNISNPAAIPPFGFSQSAMEAALSGAGIVTILHANVGVLVLILSLVVLILSLRSRLRGAQIFGSLGFLAILFAADGGLLFVLSGFQDDGRSHQMATLWLLSFVFYFIEVYVLKPAP